MAELIAQTHCAGLLPVTIGNVTLREDPPGRITSLMPRADEARRASEALKVAHGMRFPAAGRVTGKAGARAVWTGLNQAFLIGPDPDPALAATCAMTDQSDAWAVMLLEGGTARQVLARLCPLDLRDKNFKRGHTARSLLGHMNASISRIGPESWMMLVFRSMARTTVHEITDAMNSVAARP